MTDGLFRSEQIFKPRSADYVKIDYISSLARIEGDYPEKKEQNENHNQPRKERKLVHTRNKQKNPETERDMT
jgi:hypothetical protein